jgi:hypothetical protein
MNNEINKTQHDLNEPDANRDPITGQPGAHPVGTGVGAAGAGTVGAVVGGVVGGPVGAVIGSAIGAAAGGLIGKNVAEAANPTVEDAYWRENYKHRPYVDQNRSYEDYQPAYRTGYEGYNRHSGTGRTYDEVEPDLRREYETNYGTSGLGWDHARHATRDAWTKVESINPTTEDSYWRENYANQPYFEQGRSYEDYQPAYRSGYEAYGRYYGTGRTYDEVEPELQRDYERSHGTAGLGWERAKHAARAAWHRLENAVPGDRRNRV